MTRGRWIAVYLGGVLTGLVLSIVVYMGNQFIIARRTPPEEKFTSEQMLEVYRKVRKSALVVRAHTGNQSALGSGVVVLANHGRVVAFTNGHVVASEGRRADRVEVKPFGTRVWYPARIVNVLLDEKRNLDLAVLTFNDIWQRETAATLIPETETAAPGKVVIAVGNPRGDEFLTDHGHIKDVSVRGDIRVVIHDALTEHGSSGGGLFDIQGRLLGINTWLAADRYGVAAEIHSLLKAFKVQSELER
jgi:S1-C subfamily serine protease